jgi:RluA family pseudouridine synthase
LSLEVLFEDSDLAVIWKPSGINVSGNQFKTIQNALMFNLKKSIGIDALNWPKPVHRLDNQTSGVLVIAKSKKARVVLGQAFENKTIEKTYHAIVIGHIEKAGVIDFEVDNKKSVTEFEPIQFCDSLKNEKLTLLKLMPKTGRTHQLRIHCAQFLKSPILGDKIYGSEGMILKNKGLFLSATGITFNHPNSNKIISITKELPPKFFQRMNNEQRRFDNYNLNI